MAAPTERGVEGFIESLRALGLNPEHHGQLIVFTVEAVDGAYAGHDVATGVEINELASWPATPPHWVHLPAAISLPTTNSGPSPRQDWEKHSRKIARWGNADPGTAWVAHVRTVLGEAV